MHIIYIVTVSMTADNLLRGQLRALHEHGHEVNVITSPSSDLEAISVRESVDVIAVPIQREINLFQDILSLWYLFRVLYAIKPDLVNASTPKAGLLGMVAACLAKVPIRIYQQRGLRLETTTGFMRKLLVQLEKTAVFCAHQVVCNSESLRARCLELGIGSPEKLIVLGAGSSNGVDIKRFHPQISDDNQVNSLKKQLNLGEGHVIGFVGRLVKDKGIEELVASFTAISQSISPLHLLLVGPLEEGDPISPETRNTLETEQNIHITGYVDDTAPYYHLMDLLVFSSYREGFPNVPLEAAASGLPVIGYKATGTVDAIVDEETGLLVEIGDIESLSKSIKFLLNNPDRMIEMGKRGRERVVEKFASEIVWQNWIEYYSQFLED